MAKRPDLVVLNGALKNQRFAVGEGALRLGRSSSNDIHVPDEELSRNHCIFERSGETGIRLTDLASANGTVVNGRRLGNDPVELKEGDVIEVGRLRISVGDANIDLGLGTSSVPTEAKVTTAPKRSPLANILWVVAILIAVGAIVVILFAPNVAKEQTQAVNTVRSAPVLRGITYEKVQANAQGIFRYALKYDADGRLTVALADTKNNRFMSDKSRILSSEDQAALSEILAWKAVSELEGDHTGVEPDPPVLESAVLKVIYSSGVRTVSVVNTDGPEAFASICKRLEDFSQVQLGVSAIAYSRDELVRRSSEATRIGEGKWGERDVDYVNLSEAIKAYKEALFYLETVNPKPDFVQTAQDGLKRATAERDRRVRERQINAEKEIGVRRWEEAREELKIILQMVPERDDDRHRAAKGKLLEVENNLKREGGRR